MAGVIWPINIHFLDPSPIIAEHDVHMLNRMIDQQNKILSDIPTFMGVSVFVRAIASGFNATMRG